MTPRSYLGWIFAFSLLCSATGLAASGAKPSKPAPPTRTAAKNPTNKGAARAPVQTPPATNAAEPASVNDAPHAGTKSYKLRYKFKPGETIRWEVEHRVKIRTTIASSTQADESLATTQTAETLSKSVKVWNVQSVDKNGNATFIHSVDHVSMWQKFDGRQETHYDSDTDAVPPPGYGDVAKAIGKPMAELTIDLLGTVVKREEKFVQPTPAPDNVTLPLPENAVAVGEEWTAPADISVDLPQQNIRKKIKARQLYRLDSVDDGIASIRLETQLLTPVNDPVIESQLVQSKANGTVRFDIAAGRILSQQSDVDEHVTGFQGPASNMHYVMRFTEKLLPDEKRAALGPRQAKKK